MPHPPDRILPGEPSSPVADQGGNSEHRPQEAVEEMDGGGSPPEEPNDPTKPPPEPNTDRTSMESPQGAKKTEPHDPATIQNPRPTRPNAGETSVTQRPKEATTWTSGSGDNDPTMNPQSPHFFHEQMLCATSHRDPSFDAYLSLGKEQRNDEAKEAGSSTGDCRRDRQGEKNETLHGASRREEEVERGRRGRGKNISLYHHSGSSQMRRPRAKREQPDPGGWE